MLKKLLNKDSILGLLLFIVIIIAAIFFSLKDNQSENETVKNQTISDEVNITELLSKITDNYTVAVNIIKKEEKSNYNYSRDSKIEYIDEGDNSNKAYFVYNKKYYSVDINKYTLTKVKSIPNYNNPYANLDLIKNVIKTCEFKQVNENNKSCTIKTSTYFDEYNNIYKTKYNGEEDMSINISYYPSRIYSIIIDYTNVDKVINNGEDNLKYALVFSDIGKNDYTKILDYYKKYFKK